MVNGLIDRKIGMTQILKDDGAMIPVTVVQAGPCVVIQKQAMLKDGYGAGQLGFVEFIKPKDVTKPMGGHFKKANSAPVRILREMRAEGEESVNPGEKVMVGMFNANEK